MRKLLLAISFLIITAGYSQDTTGINRKDTPAAVGNSDQPYSDSQKEEIDRMTQRSADFFVQYQKEKRAKQKKQAIIYIALGIFFLIILIIGLRRRVKK